MTYNKREKDKYNIHLIQTDKFKTITINVRFKRKLVKEEITKRNLLVNVLTEGTKNYPSKRLMEIKTEELYDLAYRSVNFSTGKYTVLSFDMTFINPKYTEENMDLESLKFLFEIIYNPNIKDNKFDDISYKNSYKLMKDYLSSLKEDTAGYSQMRMQEEMNEEIISYRNSGYIEDLNNISEEELYNYYLDVIKNDCIDIFVIGDFDNDKMIELIDSNIKVYDNKKIDDNHFYEIDNIRNDINVVREKVDKEQSTLCLGFKLDNLSDFEKRYVITIYNYILGGSTESNLFNTLREENSLCYYVTSSNQALISISSIRLGINSSDYDQALNLINMELNNMKNGIFDDKKIENAKNTYINSLSELMDNPDSIISFYTGMEYLKSDDIDTRKEKIMKVTKEDIIKLANKIHLSVIYLLEGSDNNE